MLGDPAGAGRNEPFLKPDRIDDQHSIVPATDRVTGAAWGDVGRMFTLVHVDRPNDIHKTILQRNRIVGLDDLVNVTVELPIEENIYGHAGETRIVDRVTHSIDSLPSRLRQLHSGPATAHTHAHAHSGGSGTAGGGSLRRGPGAGKIELPLSQPSDGTRRRIEFAALIVAPQRAAVGE